MTSWQAEDDFTERRRGVIADVIALLRERVPESSATAPKIARELEAKLFAAATSLAEYEDPTTLLQRLELPSSAEAAAGYGSEDDDEALDETWWDAWLADTPSIWFFMTLLMSLLHVGLGLGAPTIAAEEVGGVNNAAARVWVRAACSGHAVVAFLCVNAIRAPRDSPVRTLVLRAIALHSVAFAGAMTLGQVTEGLYDGLNSNVTMIFFSLLAMAYFKVPPAPAAVKPKAE